MKNIGYHKNIVNMIGCSTIKQPLCLLVEYMIHGDLLHYLRKRRSRVSTLHYISNELQIHPHVWYNDAKKKKTGIIFL